MAKFLQRFIPDTCRRQMLRAGRQNRQAVESLLKTIDEFEPFVIQAMKEDRRHVLRA